MAHTRKFLGLSGLVCTAVLSLQPAFGGGDKPAGQAKAPIENVAVATDARLGGDGGRTRFIVDLSQSINLSAFTLADPYRVVLDLPQIAFQLPAKTGETGRGLVKAFRFGLVMPGGSRIVLDASGPVRIDKAFVLDPVDGQPARLVLDLVSIDRETFMRNLAAEKRPGKSAGPARKDDRESNAATGDNRPVVVIDPGHGGLDIGTAASGGYMEKAIVLEFARTLQERLEKKGKYRVVMTRTDDSFVSLSERVRIARAERAALFISIHADSLPRPDPDTRGATVYTVSDDASDAEAARLAESENKADVIAGVDLSAEPGEVADILIDLAQRETRRFSAQFARTMVGELKGSVRLHKHPLRSAGFKVLKASDIPSVLLELGYVTSPHDLKLMTSGAWRKRATGAIAQAVDTFFAPRLAGSSRRSRAD